MAPITPFLTDYVWNALRGAGAPESVHLARWPVADAALIDESLSTDMALTRRLVELGRSARAAATVKIRQPLARALIGAAGFASLPPELRTQVAEELNVHALETMATVDVELVDYAVKPNYRRWAAGSASGPRRSRRRSPARTRRRSRRACAPPGPRWSR